MRTLTFRRIPKPLGMAALALALAAPVSFAASGVAGASMSSAPGTSFSVASVPRLGKVLVDGHGHTVYLLTSGHGNVMCSDSNGCTKVWPDLPLPKGDSAAKAGPGVQASLLGTKKLSDGETYPTYHGWLMYEYVGDSGPGQAGGEGITSFGGTWYAISPSGNPVKSASQSSSSGGSGSTRGSTGGGSGSTGGSSGSGGYGGGY